MNLPQPKAGSRPLCPPRLILAGLALAMLVACTPREPARDADLPPMKTFAAARPAPPQRPNVNIAQDFLELSFEMEDGRSLPVLSRFEGPVQLAVTGAIPEVSLRDLDLLIARLRAEAEIDITRIGDPSGAQIVVEFLPRATLQSFAPQTACFVVPRVGSWSEFRRNRRAPLLDWTTLSQRERIAVFVPQDTSPQEIRDCLHEEIAQALGPLNDLYRLSDSIFNDDNFHSVLTGFDMLILRTYYAPELASGMSRNEVAARLPAILRRLNPAGERPALPDPGPTPRDWLNAIEVALAPERRPDRLDAARYAVLVAQDAGWQDSRLGLSLYAMGRAAAADFSTLSVASFLRAGLVWRDLPGAEVHIAHIDMQMAAFALTADQPDHALALADRAIGPARQAQNAALLASVLMLRATALSALGRDHEARADRLDSLGWARYGFGSDQEVRDRMAEIAALAAPAQEGG
ncbi:DUF2927 domain-containing protein [Plastorhodobacter daqingensis]|uniref:DUF2927 domain-containing protein n=1 Tax=Plastorhodobacter daqingensis TaxID=1387281 RepID=A0ABW2UL13_9RHOB